LHVKFLTTPAFWWILGALTPKMLTLIILTPKRHILGWKLVVWAINRENPSKGSTWARAREKKSKQDNVLTKKAQRNISHMWGEAPANDNATKFGTWVSRTYNHTCQILRWKFKGFRFYRGSKFGFLHWLCIWALTQCCATALHVMFQIERIQDIDNEFPVKIYIDTKSKKIQIEGQGESVTSAVASILSIFLELEKEERDKLEEAHDKLEAESVSKEVIVFWFINCTLFSESCIYCYCTINTLLYYKLCYCHKAAFTPWQHVACCHQHVATSNMLTATKMLPVCCPSVAGYKGIHVALQIQATMLPATSNMFPGNMLLVAGNMLLVRGTCCQATCCPGIYAALLSIMSAVTFPAQNFTAFCSV